MTLQAMIVNNDKNLYPGTGDLLPGDEVIDFRGETWIFDRASRAGEPGRSAKVEVHLPGDSSTTREFYVQVFPGMAVISD